MNVVVKDFPDDLWNRFKSLAALKGETVRQLLKDTLEEKLDNKGESAGPA